VATTVPVIQGATIGQPANAGAVNQFLAAHSATFLYDNTVFQSGQIIGSAVYTSTENLYLAQQLVTTSTQTQVGTITLQMSVVSGSPLTPTIAPLVVSIYESNAGQPVGDPLATVSLLETYVYSGSFFLLIPLILVGLTPSTTYWIVVQPAGDSSTYYVWQQSNQASGALTSTDGSTWVPQGYGFMYQVFDFSAAILPVQFIIEDGGAKITQFTYNASSQLVSITETTQAQSGNDVVSTRDLTYTNNYLTGVA